MQPDRFDILDIKQIKIKLRIQIFSPFSKYILVISTLKEAHN